MNTEISAQSLQKFIKNLNRLQPEYSGNDRTWLLPMRTGKRPKDWSLARVTHYQNTYYFSWTACDLSLELDPKGRATNSALENLHGAELKKFSWSLNHFTRQVHRIEKDWAGVHRKTLRDCPLSMRYGIVPQSIIWQYYPDTYRPDIKLGKAHVAKFIAQTRAYKFHDEFGGHHQKMTLGLFMRYCQAAYLANKDEFKGAVEPGTSGLKLYKRLADGRDEGLSELPLNSADAFNKWYRSKRGGGHPWEIYRGGNTTHISLGVTERHEGWSVWLAGSSTVRMVETLRIALALLEAGLPVEVPDAGNFVLRLLGMDNVGIIPDYRSHHRANQDFETADKVFDCAHLYELPRNNRILPFVTWKPVAPLRPAAV